MRQPRFDTAILAITALCAVIVTVLVVRREFRDSTVVQNRVPVHVTNWEEYATDGHVIGPERAPVTVVVFSDFQCPFCRRFSGVLDSAHAHFPRVRFIQRHYPLTSIHNHAFQAALAAECADDRGRYYAMREALYKRPGLVEDGDWGLLAALSGISDTVALVECVRLEKDSARVYRDIQAGDDLGVNATPTVLVNDLRFPVPPTYAELDSILVAVSKLE
jgi:protein-disulfide isomerase